MSRRCNNLGNELTRVSRQPEKGATSPVRKKAQQTAMAALRGKLFKISYQYVVLDDPDGKGFLVYALGVLGKPRAAVIAGHVRVTISENGEKVERVDRLSHTLMTTDVFKATLPQGTTPVGEYMNQIVSDKPVETLIFSANLLKEPIFVSTPNGKVWRVENGKMSIDDTKPGEGSLSAAAHKALKR